MNLQPSPTTKSLVMYFQVHQPLRLRKFQFFDIGSSAYFDDSLNRDILERVARECYLPTNSLLLTLIKHYPDIRVAFSISGITLDQFAIHTPEVMHSFRALAETGCVEFLAETQYHSLASMINAEEFEEQVVLHSQKIYEYLGVRPRIFRNTELIYNDELGVKIANLGFQGVFCDGIERVLNGRSVHHLYQHPTEKALKIFLRNYRLSDDIAFRFNKEYGPLTAEKYMAWLNAIPEQEDVITIAMDYETFGEHHKRASGILTFLEDLVLRLVTSTSFKMATPSEVIETVDAHDSLSIPHYISWADRERDLSAWLGNAIQQDAYDSLLTLEEDVKKLKDEDLLHCWRLLSTSDHFYYMSTKKDDDGNVHNYFSPYPSPYEAFINYMNVLSDFSLLIKKKMATLASRKTKRAIHMIELVEVIKG